MTPEQYASSYTYSNLLNYARGVVTDAKVFSNSLCVWLRDRTWEKGWFDEVHGAEKSAPTLTDFVKEPAPNGIGSSVEWVEATLEAAVKLGINSAEEAARLFNEQIEAESGKSAKAALKDAITSARTKKPLEPAMSPEQSGALGGRGNKGIVKNNTFTAGSTNAEYLTRRIARDAPEIAARLAAGGFPSVRQAAIAAGIVKEKSVVEKLASLWAKASDDERQAFLAHIRNP